jgi:hypothetical protein
MTKKIVKLMMATALATGTTLGFFMESANAQFVVGRPYSLPSNLPDIRFTLLVKDNEGNEIKDTFMNEPNVGFFPGAIKDFKYLYSAPENSNDPLSTPVNFPGLNLKAEKLGDTNVSYTISETTGSPVMTFVLDSNSLPIDNLTSDIKEECKNIDFGIDFVNIVSNILENNVFACVSHIKYEGYLPFEENEDTMDPSPRNISRSFKPENDITAPITVPEHSNTASLFALAVLGVGSLRKHKMK